MNNAEFTISACFVLPGFHVVKCGIYVVKHLLCDKVEFSIYKVEDMKVA